MPYSDPAAKLDPDPLTVGLEPISPIPPLPPANPSLMGRHDGRPVDPPAPLGLVRWGCGVCLGVWLLALVAVVSGWPA